jgi:acetyl-CoA carboxylase alpha subunit
VLTTITVYDPEINAMSRTPARCTQADLARAIRASQQTNAGDVVLHADGSIVISMFRSAQAVEPITIVLDDKAVIPL